MDRASPSSPRGPAAGSRSSRTTQFKVLATNCLRTMSGVSSRNCVRELFSAANQRSSAAGPDKMGWHSIASRTSRRVPSAGSISELCAPRSFSSTAQIGQANAPALQFLAVSLFGQVRLATKKTRGLLDTLMEWKIFESMQCVLETKDVIGPSSGNNSADCSISSSKLTKCGRGGRCGRLNDSLRRTDVFFALSCDHVYIPCFRCLCHDESIHLYQRNAFGIAIDTASFGRGWCEGRMMNDNKYPREEGIGLARVTVQNRGHFGSRRNLFVENIVKMSNFANKKICLS